MQSIKEVSPSPTPVPIQLANGKRLSFDSPLVMGIVNITPDSFYDGGSHFEPSTAVEHAELLIKQGADIIDLGACSTRPGAEDIGADEELKRLLPVLETLVRKYPDAVISIDTYRAKVAEEAVKRGAVIINDISGGTMDKLMFETVGKLKVPYVLMHMQGTPKTMQREPHYTDVGDEIEDFFSSRIEELHLKGVKQIIIDPGFGFGKNTEHNFLLLKHLQQFVKFGLPILAGISRKSMINKVLGVKPASALNGATVLNTIALLNGANILRVHDVTEAKQAIKLVEAYRNSQMFNSK